MTANLRRLLRAVVNAPETNVAVFAFLLNLPWEFLQSPLFNGMAAAPHWQAVKICSLAAIADAGIATAVFWSVAAVTRSRRWVSAPTRATLLGFVIVGIFAAVLIERFGWWVYADSMPIIPVLGIGAAPFVQWLILPPCVVWFVHRQLRSKQ